MSPVNPAKLTPLGDAHEAERRIREVISAHKEWFLSLDGRAPLSVNSDELDFSVAQSRLIFSSWTETGVRTSRVSAWNWTGEKLILQASRRLGAETATIELVPQASAKAIVASIAAARQERCERLAQLVAQSLEGAGRRGSGVVGTDQDHESKTRSWHHGDSPSPLHP